MQTGVTQIFGIRYPVIQGGMIWAAGAELAAAVSNAGGLGLIGSGSMYPDELIRQIRWAKSH
ncbi:MAG TPA: nitronate monooxygenase, partial [Bacteroidetes bacterium]|nr:nitronate monooxygenase [Bacteroidota bacterium]